MSCEFREAFRSAIRRVGARVVKDLPREQSGQALIEAALIFPLLVGLFLGVSEFCEGFTVSRRVDAAAGTAADLVARQQMVTAADLNSIKAMVEETIKPFPIASVGLVVTSVIADKSNATTVAWSEAMGTGVSPYATGSTVSLPVGLTFPETSLIVAEVRYTFQSTLSTMLVGPIALGAKAYQRPRFAMSVAKQN
ncbi:MAG: pilus assembly protein [Rhodospirillales bacterium]|nr:pilus assembly protein [Rhodospirillales bacterium]